MAYRESLRHSATVMARNLRTSDYSRPARDRLAGAVAQARRAAGHRFRPSFAAEAGISKRSLEAVELNDASVGVSILEDIGRALGKHFAEWSADTPRTILEGGPVPSLESVPEPTDVNEEMLTSLREMRDLLDRSPVSGPEAAEFMDRLAQTWRQQEKDLGRYTRTLRIFTDETERDTPVAERKTRTPNE